MFSSALRLAVFHNSELNFSCGIFPRIKNAVKKRTATIKGIFSFFKIEVSKQIAYNVEVFVLPGPLLTSSPAQPIIFIQKPILIFKSLIENVTSMG